MGKVLLLLCLLVLSNIGLAGNKEGLDAWNREDYDTSFKELFPIAQRGDSLAQFMVGNMYANGLGVGKNISEAWKWYMKSAQQGHRAGQYAIGLNTDINLYPEEAKAWLEKSANQGYAAAQYELGMRYLEGRGVLVNHVLATQWLRKSAMQQDAYQAQYNLGVCYAKGMGVPLDFVEAYVWFRLALENDYAAAKRALVIAEAELTVEQKKEAEKRYQTFRSMISQRK